MPAFATQKEGCFELSVTSPFITSREVEKLETTMVSLDEEGLARLQWEDRCRLMRSWPKFKSNLIDRFLLTQEGSVFQKVSYFAKTSLDPRIFLILRSLLHHWLVLVNKS